MFTAEAIPILVQGGAMSLALVSMYLLWQSMKKQAGYVDLLVGLVSRNTEAMVGLKEAVAGLTRSNEELHDTVTSQAAAQLAAFQEFARRTPKE